MGLDTKYDIDQMMEEWRINGFVVFDDLIPTEIIDRILEAWIPIRDRDIERQGKYPPRGYHRYNVRVPFKRPFVDPVIFEHPALVAFWNVSLVQITSGHTSTQIYRCREQIISGGTGMAKHPFSRELRHQRSLSVSNFHSLIQTKRMEASK